MAIKFECKCGHRMKAPDGSQGRWVRCSQCEAKVAVPGENANGPSGGTDLSTGVKDALEWQEEINQRRAAPAARWLSPTAEQWLMEHGLWVPAGIAIMAIFGLAGLVSYVAGFLSPLPFCMFMFLVGFGVFVYGRVGND